MDFKELEEKILNIESLLQTLVEDKKTNVSDLTPQTLKYYTREEVCQTLRISKPTLDSYTRLGIIKGNRVGRRVLYTVGSVEGALKDIPNIRNARTDNKFRLLSQS